MQYNMIILFVLSLDIFTQIIRPKQIENIIFILPFRDKIIVQKHNAYLHC